MDPVYRMTSIYQTKLPSDEERWITIYPAYINSCKRTSEGRRVPLQKAVDNPTSQEILDIVKSANLNCKIEKKMYPREPNRDLQFQGRVRVQLRKEDGTPVNPQYASRKDLMLFAAEMIPKLKSRQGRTTTQVELPGQKQGQKKKR